MAYLKKPSKYDNDKNFYTMLLEKGMPYMFASQCDVTDDSTNAPRVSDDSGKTRVSSTGTRNSKKILIVGAGISGLAAAYELKRAGHEVVLVESEQRVGGKIKTLSFDFDNHEYKAEGGPMRIPLGNHHYLTTGYINKFGLEMVPFFNKDKEGNCFYKVLGYESIKISDFSSDATAEARARAKTMCDQLWPGWDSTLKARNISHVNDIIDYYDKTVEELLCGPMWPKPDESVDDYNKRWHDGMEYGGEYSVMAFLKSEDALKDHKKPAYRSWPKEAIHAFNCLNYSPCIDSSLAAVLADERVWTSEMRTLKDGMETLPQAFLKSGLEENIRYGLTVTNIQWKHDDSQPVRIWGRHTRTGTEFHIDADAVIIAVPLNNIRQIEFVPSLPQHLSNAISEIEQWISTKIFLGFRKKFWEQTKFPVTNGGISKTNLPITQILYPRQNKKQGRGVLAVYSWGKESHLFSSITEDQAIREALKQVQLVYSDQFTNSEDASKVSEFFEVGAVQHSMCDYSASAKYVNNQRMLLKLGNDCDIRPVYLAGEAVSPENGWIQGGLDSGLRAAWQFYKFNEQNTPQITPA